MKDFEEHEMPYRKKRHRTVKKANHKHIYEHVLLHGILPDKYVWNAPKQRWVPGLQCSVCGKYTRDYQYGIFDQNLNPFEAKDWPVVEIRDEDYMMLF